MSRFLVGSLTPERWYLHPEILWLLLGEAPADALRDLRPKKGTLSVFEVPDTADRMFIEKIVVAIAAKGKEEPVDVGFRLFDSRAVTDLGIPVDAAVRGDTGDEEINVLHRNLEHLSAEKLGRLTTAMAHGEHGELLSKRFGEILVGEVTAGRLALRGVHGKLRKTLDLDGALPAP